MTRLHFEKVSRIDAPARELYAWHARPGAFVRLIPPWQNITLPGGQPQVAEGSRVTIRMRRGPVPVTWVAEHRDVRPGKSFRDVMVSGPFAEWEHLHECLDDGPGASRLRDSIHYRMHGGAIGHALMSRTVTKDVQSTFDYRHRTTQADLALHERFRDQPRLTVAISGASGLVGSALEALLTTGGHRVLRLVRRPPESELEIAWSTEAGVEDLSRLDGVDAVVHLAGENIAGGRWTRERRRRILESRVRGTRSLIESLGRLEQPPASFLGASAIGFYGPATERAFDESGALGEGFLAEVCAGWEAELDRARGLGCRTAICRLGVVASPQGGFLRKMLPAFRAGLGGVVGSGEQVMSWISIDDAISAIYFALLSPDFDGVFNAVAPNAVTQRELAETLATTLGRPAIVPLPAFAARALFGRMADETLLADTHAVPAALEGAGFEFRHPSLGLALSHLLGR